MLARSGSTMVSVGWVSLLVSLLVTLLQLASAQTTDVEQDGGRGAGRGDERWKEVALAALVVGVVACAGVAILALIVACLLARSRKEKKEWSPSNAVAMMEKAPVPDQDTAETTAAQRLVQSTMRQGSVSVGVGTLRQVSLSLLQDLLLNLYNVNVKRADHAPKRPNVAVRKDSDLTVTPAGADEVQRQLRNGLMKIFPHDRARVDTFLSVGQAIMAATTVRQLLDAALRAMRLCVGQLRQWDVLHQDYVGLAPTEGQGHVSVMVEDEVNSLTLTWDSDKFNAQLLSTVAILSQALRDERRQPTPEEYLAMQLAYYALGKGQAMTDITHRPLGSPGFHPHVQTQLALTDSGYGHVLGTTRRSDWLQGVVVHVQHIGALTDADLAPSLYDLARVRLHVGDASPTTFFVSRHFSHQAHAPGPGAGGESLRSEVWEAELSRVVQQTANSISSAFYHGAAACHVSMAGLTTGQAAAFMAQLRPYVQRERHLQALSALWDLGSPLTDDYGVEGQPEQEQEQEQVGVGKAVERGSPVVRRKKVLTEPHHIARRVIDITLVGGFDQVTWFSSCDETQAPASSGGGNQSEPPTCVLRCLTSQQILSLVHHAHSRGLLTYFTGGVTCRDIQPAVMGGVDGVGVGGVGTLHHEKTGRNGSERHGPYLEENIPQVLACRDEAAHTPQGQAAHLLSRLDTMFFEGSLASAENALRSQLFNAIVDKDNAVIASILSKFEDVMQMPAEAGHPVMGVAGRLVARKTPALKDVAESAYEWAMFITRLNTLVSRGDERAVCEEYGGEPWHTYRKKYRERREGPQGFFRQVSFQVELKTDF